MVHIPTYEALGNVVKYINCHYDCDEEAVVVVAVLRITISLLVVRGTYCISHTPSIFDIDEKASTQIVPPC